MVLNRFVIRRMLRHIFCGIKGRIYAPSKDIRLRYASHERVQISVLIRHQDQIFQRLLSFLSFDLIVRLVLQIIDLVDLRLHAFLQAVAQGLAINNISVAHLRIPLQKTGTHKISADSV